MKRIYYVGMLLLISIVSINAQVRIGNNTEPHKGAVLDLQSTETTGKGVLFPLVNLTSLATFAPVEGTATEGMVVYNINETLGRGVYVWDGEQWMNVGDGNTLAVGPPIVTITADKTPANTTAGTTVALTATVATVGPNTYQWYKNGTAISDATNSTYTITSIVLSDRYSCVVTNSLGNTTAFWSTCGAATVNGGWLVFMCHNLGADTTKDPFSYDEGTLGDLYQWGRRTDGHEKRTSGSTTTLATSNTPGHANFILAAVDPYNWRSGGGNNASWGNGTVDAVNPTKGSNDPCPSGWKVPSKFQWLSIYQTNTSETTTTPDVAVANRWSWTGNGFKVGNSLYLPAAGMRAGNAGSFSYVGQAGFYWSSTIGQSPNSSHIYATAGSFALSFSNGGISHTENSGRSNGFSVRCIAE